MENWSLAHLYDPLIHSDSVFTETFQFTHRASVTGWKISKTLQNFVLFFKACLQQGSVTRSFMQKMHNIPQFRLFEYILAPRCLPSLENLFYNLFLRCQRIFIDWIHFFVCKSNPLLLELSLRDSQKKETLVFYGRFCFCDILPITEQIGALWPIYGKVWHVGTTSGVGQPSAPAQKINFLVR